MVTQTYSSVFLDDLGENMETPEKEKEKKNENGRKKKKEKRPENEYNLLSIPFLLCVLYLSSAAKQTLSLPRTYLPVHLLEEPPCLVAS